MRSFGNALNTVWDYRFIVKKTTFDNYILLLIQYNHAYSDVEKMALMVRSRYVLNQIQ